jgi:hypothetical protein
VGRFGKSLDRLAELSRAGESPLCSCVGLNPTFKHKTHVGHDAIALAGAFSELRKSTNVVLGSTNERLIVVGTGFAGAPRDDYSIPYDGLEIVSREAKEFVLGWPEGQVRIRGAAKQQVPDFLDTLAAQARPRSAPVEAEGP